MESYFENWKSRQKERIKVRYDKMMEHKNHLNEISGYDGILADALRAYHRFWLKQHAMLWNHARKMFEYQRSEIEGGLAFTDVKSMFENYDLETNDRIEDWVN